MILAKVYEIGIVINCWKRNKLVSSLENILTIYLPNPQKSLEFSSSEIILLKMQSKEIMHPKGCGEKGKKRICIILQNIENSNRETVMVYPETG